MGARTLPRYAWPRRISPPIERRGRTGSTSGFDPEQPASCAAEDLDPVLVTEPGDRHDVVDRHRVPRERVIGAEHHMIDPGLGDQVAHPLPGEHDRIEI